MLSCEHHPSPDWMQGGLGKVHLPCLSISDGAPCAGMSLKYPQFRTGTGTASFEPNELVKAVQRIAQCWASI